MKLMRMKAIGALDNDRSYYILVKESSIERPLNEIMEKIGSDVLYYGEEDYSPTGYENRVGHIVARQYDIDIIYTANRIVLIVRAPKEQKVFRELVLAYSKF